MIEKYVLIGEVSSKGKNKEVRTPQQEFGLPLHKTLPKEGYFAIAIIHSIDLVWQVAN